jgi:hypothetical protein
MKIVIRIEFRALPHAVVYRDLGWKVHPETSRTLQEIPTQD